MLSSLAKRLAVAATPRLLWRPIAVPTPMGFRFTLTPDDPQSVKMASGCYERENVALYKSLELGPGTVVDVGANVGFYALLFARTFPDRTVHAIEPNPYCVERLHQNRRANPRLAHRIFIHECAIGDCESVVSPVAVPGASVTHGQGLTYRRRRDCARTRFAVTKQLGTKP
jgi:hypothetical protein